MMCPVNLQLSSLNSYYLHQPDTEHPLTDTLAEMTKLAEEGLIQEAGGSYTGVNEEGLGWCTCVHCMHPDS